MVATSRFRPLYLPENFQQFTEFTEDMFHGNIIFPLIVFGVMPIVFFLCVLEEYLDGN